MSTANVLLSAGFVIFQKSSGGWPLCEPSSPVSVCTTDCYWALCLSAAGSQNHKDSVMLTFVSPLLSFPPLNSHMLLKEMYVTHVSLALIQPKSSKLCTLLMLKLASSVSCLCLVEKWRLSWPPVVLHNKDQLHRGKLGCCEVSRLDSSFLWLCLGTCTQGCQLTQRTNQDKWPFHKVIAFVFHIQAKILLYLINQQLQTLPPYSSFSFLFLVLDIVVL